MKTFLSFIPSFVRPLVFFFIGTLAVFLLARLIMLVLVWNSVIAEPPEDVLKALYIGIKFDMRMAVFGLIPLGLFLAVPRLEQALVENSIVRLGIDLLYGIGFFFTLIIYTIDFGYFFYMRQRVDATLFDFLGNPDISGQMVWQSYPVVWIGLGLFLLTLFYVSFINWLLKKHQLTLPLGWKRRSGWSLLAFVMLFLVAYGQISSNFFPLRWSNAYFSINKDIALLALNPIQNLRDTTHAAQGTRPDLQATRNSYRHIAEWLGVPDPDPQILNFTRTFPLQADLPHKKGLNVIIIIMESMTWPRTSFAPNLTSTPDDPTPNLRELAKDSLYFSQYFAPARTTARAIFTTMTGIPDVNRSGGTSSRNQVLVDQSLVMNQFEGYEKFYMIGGSASWANIRGVLTHNIEDLHLMEEGAWKSPNVDVWGISDLALFRETADVLTKARQPFVTVIQTAGFHRPYTIPADNAGFQIKQPSSEILKNYGYMDAAEYNSLRFSDHALGEFMNIARTKPWFNNTVFVIFGDHGLNDTSANMKPGYLACHLQSNHVPMLLYAPGLVAEGLLKPGEYTQPCGHTDIFPTVASLAGISFHYKGLGRNLLDPRQTSSAMQFIAGDAEAFIRLVKDGYCYIREETEGLYNLEASSLENLLEKDTERALEMRRYAEGFYNVSKYLLYNNKKMDE